MADSLVLVQGPPGSGKSQRVREYLEDDPNAVHVSITPIWVMLRDIKRGDNGRYPIRKDDDVTVRNGLNAKLQESIVREALADPGVSNVYVESGTRGREGKWAKVVEEVSAATNTKIKFHTETHEVSIEVAAGRLEVDGNLSDECREALGRWFGHYRF